MVTVAVTLHMLVRDGLAARLRIVNMHDKLSKVHVLASTEPLRLCCTKLLCIFAD